MLVGARPGRLGFWSILLAVLALAFVIATTIAVASLPSGAPEYLSTAATIAVAIAYLVAAPILHVVGAILGIVGLARGGESKTRCVVGILLNVVLVTIGALFAWVAASGIGAYT